MADFVLLYRGGSMPETEEARAAAMDAWTSWFATLGSAVKDPGNPFSETAKSISGDGAIADVAAGTASGYSIIEADTLDAAVDLAKGCPVLQDGAEVHVYETFPVM